MDKKEKQLPNDPVALLFERKDSRFIRIALRTYARMRGKSLAKKEQEAMARLDKYAASIKEDPNEL